MTEHARALVKIIPIRLYYTVDFYHIPRANFCEDLQISFEIFWIMEDLNLNLEEYSQDIVIFSLEILQFKDFIRTYSKKLWVFFKIF